MNENNNETSDQAFERAYRQAQDDCMPKFIRDGIYIIGIIVTVFVLLFGIAFYLKSLQYAI